MATRFFDENMAHGFSQAFTRYTWEALQTWGGYNTTQIRNLAGNVSRFDYLGGATFATNEQSSHHRGFTIGNYVNMSIHGEITMPFRDWCLYGDQMYLHEYGHTIQSQLTGFAYLFAIGLPSLISCNNSAHIGRDPYQASTHDYSCLLRIPHGGAARIHGKAYLSGSELRRLPPPCNQQAQAVGNHLHHELPRRRDVSRQQLPHPDGHECLSTRDVRSHGGALQFRHLPVQ